MSKKKKLLMWLIVCTGMLQMPSIAVSAAVNTISTVVFPEYALVQIQTSMAVTGIVSPIMSLISAILIRKEVATKRGVVIFGLGVLGFTGVLSIFMHSHFWCLAVLSVCIGIATGCYVSTAISLMIDNFNLEERRMVNGLHSVFVGLGGVLMCVVGGLLINLVWYAGYLLLMIGIPMCIFSVIAIPKNEKKSKDDNSPAVKTRLNPDVFYYVVIITVFMILYSVGGSNISIHFANSGIKNFAMLAGFATAAQMAGTVAVSFFFSRLSAKFGDMLMAAAFWAIFVGFTIVNMFSSSIVMMFIGIFIMGMSMPCIGPQCMISISKRVDTSTSAIASSLATGIGPGIGSFLSPVIITNITFALAGSSTKFRYQFAAFVALALGVAVFALNIYRGRKEKTESQL